uniref:Uncharacterized protein n=1 Tax=Neogobius melanostomus TaxID=47308 RepID=A0A8C6WV04_9GOBI
MVSLLFLLDVDVEVEEQLVISAPGQDQSPVFSLEMCRDPSGGAPLGFHTEEPCGEPPTMTWSEQESPPPVCETIQTSSPAETDEHANKTVPPEIHAQTQDSGPKKREILQENFPSLDLKVEKTFPDFEIQHNGLQETEKSKLSLLKMQSSPEELQQEIKEMEVHVPKAMYKFDPEAVDQGFNPFMSGGSRIPNSPPPCATVDPEFKDRMESENVREKEEAKDVALEAWSDEGTPAKVSPKKTGGKKTVCKVKKQTEEEVLKQEIESQPRDIAQEAAYFDDIPIPKSGSYNFDSENLNESFNPFQSGGSKIPNSPINTSIPKLETNFELEKDLEKEETHPVVLDVGLDEETALKTSTKNVQEIVGKAKKPKEEESSEGKTESQHLEIAQEMPNLQTSAPLNFDDIPIPKTGSYKFDLENLDEDYNPFQSGGSKIPNSPPPCGASSFTAKVDEEPKAEPVALQSSFDEETATKAPSKKLGSTKTIGKVKNQKTPNAEEKPDLQTDAKPSEIVQETSESLSPLDIDDIPITKTGAYNFDPENFDESFDPFQSGGSKISNSPTSKTIPKMEPQEEDLVEKTVVLEFGLDDGAVTKAPPKKLGTRKTVSKVKHQTPKNAEDKSEENMDCKPLEISQEASILPDLLRQFH